MQQPSISQDVARALAEDLGGQSPQQGDITAGLIPVDNQASASIITREACVLAGRPWAQETLRQVDERIQVTWLADDGEKLAPEQALCHLQGPARAILTAERTVLNFLQTLSGTATVTAGYVATLAGTDVTLLDTRKTLPGLRQAQKYAVRCGGGQNHRMGLFDAFLIKENHILACGSIQAAVQQARATHPGKPVEVEVESLDELRQAMVADADIVMLDNFTLAQIKQAVAINKNRCKLEVSGNVQVQNLTEIAATGIDFISSGALTKHLKSIDLSLRIN